MPYMLPRNMTLRNKFIGQCIFSQNIKEYIVEWTGGPCNRGVGNVPLKTMLVVSMYSHNLIQPFHNELVHLEHFTVIFVGAESCTTHTR